MTDRQKAEQRGRRAETLASFALICKGYSILDRRVRTPSGEIDLIAKRGKLVAFIEVKARKSHDAALQAITPKAQRRIVRAAELWMARRPRLASLDWRFDAITVVPRRWPKHTIDAWRPDN